MQPVLLINSLGPGGAERVLVNVANEWHASGRKCRIVSMYGGPMAQQLASGVDLQIWNCRTRAALPRLRNLICELNPADPILVFSTAPAVLLGALRRLGVCKNP